jgi:serine/threonine-protein kinase
VTDDLDLDIEVSGPVGSRERPKTKDGTGVLEQEVRFGRYVLTEILGKGGMAEVYLARQDGPAGFAKKVVVKRIRRALADETRFVKMFLREARTAARLNHVNTVQIFELGEEDGEYFIAMEYIEGITVQRAARRSWALEKSIPLEVILRFAADAALGLHYAHTLHDDDGSPSPLVHRDVSPDNLMVSRAGVTKVLDFGIAKPGGTSDVTQTGEIKGKIPYMSPEQIHGEPLGPATDMWSLGITLYWLLTGKRPFDGKTDPHTIDKVLRGKLTPPREINPLIPVPVQKIVMRLLERDLEQRLSNGQELHDEIVALLGPAAGPAASRAFVKQMLEAEPVEETVAPNSVITIVAACPVSDWLKREDVESLKVERKNPITPASFERARTPATHSKSLPASVVTRSHPAKRRGAVAAGVLGAVCLVGAFVGWQLVKGEPAPPPVAALPDAPALPTPPPVDDKPPPVEAPPEKPVEAAPVVEQKKKRPKTRRPSKKAAEPKAEPPPPPPAEEATVAVRVSAPARVSWYVGKKRVARGSGAAKIPASATTLKAVDTRTGCSTRVPVAKKIDYASLPTGRLSFRVRPSASVTLGRRALGSTPFDPVVLTAATCTAKLVTKAGVKKTVTVTIPPGGHEIVKANLSK